MTEIMAFVSIEFQTTQTDTLRDLTFLRELFSKAERKVGVISRTRKPFISDCDALESLEEIISALKSILDAQELLERKIRKASPYFHKDEVERVVFPPEEDTIKVESDPLDLNDVEGSLDTEHVNHFDVEIWPIEDKAIVGDRANQSTCNSRRSDINDSFYLSKDVSDIEDEDGNRGSDSEWVPSDTDTQEERMIEDLPSKRKRVHKSNLEDILSNLTASVCGEKEVKIVLERLNISKLNFPKKPKHYPVFPCKFCERKFPLKELEKQHRCFAKDPIKIKSQTVENKSINEAAKRNISSKKSIAAAFKLRRRRILVAKDISDPHVNCPDCNEDIAAKDFKTHAEEKHGFDIQSVKLKFPSFTIPLECKKCGKWFTIYKKYYFHQRTVLCGTRKPKTEKKDPHVNCPDCKEDVAAKDFKTHAEEKHGFNLQLFKLIFPTFTIPLQCNKCEKWFTIYGKYYHHQRTKLCGTQKPLGTIDSEVVTKKKKKSRNNLPLDLESADPIECYLCKEMVLPKEIKEHYGTQHGKVIEISASPPPPVKLHKQSKHSERSHLCGRCDVCGRETKSAKALKVHMLIHSEERPYKCDQCDAAFKYTNVLKLHKQNKHSERSHLCCRCDVCGRETKSAKALKVHMLIHSEERPYKCDQCDAAFKYTNVLKLHKQNKHSERSHLCSRCGMMFHTAMRLQSHTKSVHEGIRPFACHLCDKKFKIKNHLKYHVKTHANPNAKKRGYNKEK